VTGSILLVEQFAAIGHVELNGAQIGRDFDCQEATFDHLDLTNASASAIHDDENSWPKFKKLCLDGFTYGRIAKGPVTHTQRLKWLERHDFTPQPYRQLAKTLRDTGDDKGSRRVLAEMERMTWAKKMPYERRIGHLLQLTIGYGYLPLRALVWLLVLVIIGISVYWGGYLAGSIVPTDKNAYDSVISCKGLPGNYQTFHALPYSLENSFPLVKLGMEDKWTPGRASG